MSWTHKPYCSSDDVKALLNRASTKDDDLIAQLILEAQDWIDERLGFSFQTDGTLAAPATRLYDGNNHEQLVINRCLSLSTVSVREYSVPSDGSPRTFIDAPITAECLLGPQGRDPGFILTRLLGEFPLGRQNIVVTGTFGYASVPYDIQRACARLAGHYLLARDAGYEDKVRANETNYGAKTFRATSVPEDIECAIDRHRKRFFG